MNVYIRKFARSPSSQISAFNFGEYNAVITDRSHGQKYEHKTQWDDKFPLKLVESQLKPGGDHWTLEGNVCMAFSFIQNGLDSKAFGWKL